MEYCQNIWKGGEYHESIFDIVIIFVSNGSSNEQIQNNLQREKQRNGEIDLTDHEITGSNDFLNILGFKRWARKMYIISYMIHLSKT